MKTRGTQTLTAVSPSGAGRLAGVFLLLGSAAAVLNAATTAGSGWIVADYVISALGTAILGLIALFAPWDRWGQASTMALLIPGIGLLGFANYASGDPYLAGVFFVVIGIWTGLCHRRFTTVALAPLIALSFWLPLFLAPHGKSLSMAAVVVTAVTVAVGEALARLRSGLADVQDELVSANQRRFEAFGQRSSDVTIVFDATGVITYASPSVERFGDDATDLLGESVLEFMDERVDQNQRDNWSALLGDATDVTARDDVTTTRVRHRDGHWIDVEAVGQDRTDDPEIGGFIFNIRDVHDQKQLERRLEQQAFFDELTGLPNRALFRRTLDVRLASDERTAMLFIDLDGFKRVNDTAGHDVGDALLKAVAQRLQRSVPEGMLLARFGGDEFAALLGTDVMDEAGRVAAEIVESLGAPYQVGPHMLTISASVGIAVAGIKNTAEDVIRAADTAMYVAKGNATSHVAVYENAMYEQLVARLQTETLLRQAIDHHDFVLHYQPLIDLERNEPHGAEALVRWNAPSGLVGPGDFIEIAETTGLIVPLGRWILNQACTDAAGWHATGYPLKVAVNVSPRQFQDAQLLSDIRAALTSTGLPPSCLKIELTESVLVDHLDSTLAKLKELRDIGVVLALDDFGTGYSSLSYLQQLPFHVLKIDKSFIDHIETRPSDLALVRTINQLGHDLELKTLAEGVETPGQDQLIRSLGIDFAQGYHYSRPIPDEALLALLAREPGTTGASAELLMQPIV